MDFVRKVNKYGVNSLGVIIPLDICTFKDISEGDRVHLEIKSVMKATERDKEQSEMTNEII